MSRVFDEINARRAQPLKSLESQELALVAPEKVTDNRKTILVGFEFGLNPLLNCWSSEGGSSLYIPACHRRPFSDFGLCDKHYREIIGL